MMANRNSNSSGIVHAVTKQTPISVGLAIALMAMLLAGTAAVWGIRLSVGKTEVRVEQIVDDLNDHEKQASHAIAGKNLSDIKEAHSVLVTQYNSTSREVRGNSDKIEELSQGQQTMLRWADRADVKFERIEKSMDKILNKLEQ